jgi:hypothetical protein
MLYKIRGNLVLQKKKLLFVTQACDTKSKENIVIEKVQKKI